MSRKTMIEHTTEEWVCFTGLALTKARENEGLSQSDLARRIGRTQQGISQLEATKEHCWCKRKFDLFCKMAFKI